jgi:hypothetical protein
MVQMGCFFEVKGSELVGKGGGEEEEGLNLVDERICHTSSKHANS